MAQGRSTKIITMIQWIRTIGLSIDNSLSLSPVATLAEGHTRLGNPFRGYSKLRAHTALESYGSSMPRSIGPSYGRCMC